MDDLKRAVRAACCWLPEAEEVISHGSPTFKVRGKSFAMLLVNHHGDGRIALWLNVGRDLQSELLLADDRFFSPPYVGHRGWVGVHLNRGLPWGRVVELVRGAYERTAPATLVARVPRAPVLRAPKRLSLKDLDPLEQASAQGAIERVRRRCVQLPEVREVRQFGRPAWQAGRRTFAWVEHREQRLWLCVWVGIEGQALLGANPRFRVPPYVGHRGWIALELSGRDSVREIDALILESYRHFALARMRRALDVRPRGRTVEATRA